MKNKIIGVAIATAAVTVGAIAFAALRSIVSALHTAFQEASS